MKNNRDTVIVAMARTAIGDFGGTLAPIRAHELGAIVTKKILDDTGIDPGTIDDVVMGDCAQCTDEANTARTMALKVGIPDHVPAVTIQRQCSSAMQAMAQCDMYIRGGEAEIMIAGGMESMSNVAYNLPKARWGARLQHAKMIDGLWEMLHSGSTLLDPPGYIMGQTAENLARKYSIPRKSRMLWLCAAITMPKPPPRTASSKTKSCL